MTDYNKSATRGDVYTVSCWVMALVCTVAASNSIFHNDIRLASLWMIGAIGMMAFAQAFMVDGKVRRIMEYQPFSNND